MVYTFNVTTSNGEGVFTDGTVLVTGDSATEKLTNIDLATMMQKMRQDHGDNVVVKSLQIGGSFISIDDVTDSAQSPFIELAEGLQEITFLGESKITTFVIKTFRGLESLTTLVLPPLLKIIPQDMCRQCTALTTVIIGDFVTSIGVNSFFLTKSLTSIILPEGLKIMEQSAFEESKLSSIVIPSSVISTGELLFARCPLITITFAGNNLETIGRRMFFNCRNIVECIFPEGIKTIGLGTFHGAVSIENVVFPKSIITLDATQFTITETSLKTVTIADKFLSVITTSIPPNKDTDITQKLFTYTISEGSYYTIDRSGNAAVAVLVQTIARSGGDPYLRCVDTNTTVKLPNSSDVYRMYQNPRTGSVINCQVGLMNSGPDVRLGEWGKSLESGYFFTHLFIHDGEKKTNLVVDLTLDSILSDPVLKWCEDTIRAERGVENLFIGDYTARKFTVCDGGEIDLRLYPNPSIRNDLQFTLPGQMDGLLYKNYRPKLWRCNRIDDTKLMRITAGRPLTSRGIVGHLEVKEAVQHQNMFYQMFVK
jgi:hypothetical protein